MHTLHIKRDHRVGINVLPRSAAPCLLCHQHTFVSAYKIVFHPFIKKCSRNSFKRCDFFLCKREWDSATLSSCYRIL